MLQQGLDPFIVPASLPGNGTPIVSGTSMASLAPSTTVRYFGDYELLEEIARGGMGIVYRTRQVSLDRAVAVKMLLSGPLSSPELVKRFRAEASAAASLQHPNIVAIHEVGVHEGQQYFAMDFVQGQSLAKLLANGPLPAKRAAAYLKTIAEAIHYAHERGLLHRDLKPSNVLIDAADQPRVTDFGLARRLEGDSELTLSGQVLGSPNYMPPEQAAAKRGHLSRRSDVYALGAMLYHVLTGRPPFVGETITDTLSQVINTEPVSLRLLNPSVPRDLETLCLKCLEKEPAKRYASGQVLADELNRFLRNEPIEAWPISRLEKMWRRCRRKPALTGLSAATVLLLLTLAIVSPIAAFRINRERQRADLSLYGADMNLAQQAWEQNNMGRLRQLLDETQDSPHRGFEWYYWQRQSHAALKTLRGHLGWVNSVAFSSDGQRIVTASLDKTAKVWDAAGGREPLTLKGHSDHVLSVAFSADGQRIVTGSVDQTAKVWEASSGRELLTLKGHSAPILSVAFSPDGQRIVTSGWDTTAKVWQAVSEREALTLNGHSAGIWSVAFSPDGQRIVTGSGDKTAKVWEAASGREVLTLRGHSADIWSVAFSPDGQRIVTGSGDKTVKVWDAVGGGELLRLKGHGDQILSVAFSPDGQRIVTGSFDGTAKVWEAANGREVLTLKGHSAPVWSAVFSPDGQRIVTGSWDQTARVWEAASGRELLTLKGHLTWVRSVTFSPDGQSIVTGSEDKTAKVWRADRAEHVAAWQVEARAAAH
jgi:WD40 repeat protein